MLDAKLLADTHVYTDIQSVKSLHQVQQSDPELAKVEVAKQFESLLVHMLLKSMRQANAAFDSGLLSTDQSTLYQEMYDQQLSLLISEKDIGLAKSITTYIDRVGGHQETTPSKPFSDYTPIKGPFMTEPKPSDPATEDPILPPMRDATSTEAAAAFKEPHEFVEALWHHAKEAAKMIGADPRLLIAQAALETNWGKSIIQSPEGASSKNLFNIKADPSWKDKAIAKTTLEHIDGVVVKEKAQFRAYTSYLESFKDYVQFLKSNQRYKDALIHAKQPEAFAKALQKANYATDQHYSDKIMAIFSSKRFKDILDKLS